MSSERFPAVDRLMDSCVGLDEKGKRRTIVVSILSRHGMSEGFRVKGRYCPWRTQKEVVEDKKRDIGRLAVMEMRRSGWTNVGMTEDDDGMDQQVRDLL